jgi:predicted amidohydrolase YtcJ
MGGIQCAVTRRDLSGNGPYLPQEAFSVQQALDSFTAWAAYASFEENSKGKIQPGMLADFVVLSENPFEVPANHIKDIAIVATYLGGQKIFG